MSAFSYPIAKSSRGRGRVCACACVRVRVRYVSAWACPRVRVGVSAGRVSRYCVGGRRVPVVPVRVRAVFSCNPLILKGCSLCSRCSRYKRGHLEDLQGVRLDNAMHKYYEKCNFSKSLILVTGTTGTNAQ